MRKRRYFTLPVDEEPAYEADLEAHVARLKSVLAMIGPETGSKALGAMRTAAPRTSLVHQLQPPVPASQS